jgi:hypothetical protein
MRWQLLVEFKIPVVVDIILLATGKRRPWLLILDVVLPRNICLPIVDIGCPVIACCKEPLGLFVCIIEGDLLV